MLRNLRELYQYRALLGSLVQRELQARYRASVLGFLWTFLNPTLHMLVYTLLFRVYMRQNIENYAYFVFVGLLPWVWFSSSLLAGTSSVSDRRDLLTKVAFPAQVLPTTVVVTNLVNYVLSLPLMVLLGLYFGVLPSVHAVALPGVMLVQLIFTLGLVYLTSAVNVVFRDLQQILGNLVMVLFFLTPILYPAASIPEAARPYVLYANPMANLINAYQAILYDHRWPDPVPLLVLFAASLVLMAIASAMFESRREEFAEYV